MYICVNVSLIDYHLVVMVGTYDSKNILHLFIGLLGKFSKTSKQKYTVITVGGAFLYYPTTVFDTLTKHPLIIFQLIS
jgi:hypothetical protein